jgi:hypothetical protein
MPQSYDPPDRHRRRDTMEALWETRRQGRPEVDAVAPASEPIPPSPPIDHRIQSAVDAAISRGGPLEDDADLRAFVQSLATRAQRKRVEWGTARSYLNHHLWRAIHSSSLAPTEQSRAANEVAHRLGSWISAVWPIGGRDPTRDD